MRLAFKRIALLALACALGSSPALADFMKQSTAYTITWMMYDSTTHAPKTGLSPTVKISKAGGAGATSTNSAAEVDSTNLPGLYKLVLTTTETGTAGSFDVSATASGADPAAFHSQVIAIDLNDSVRLGLTALPNAAAAATGGLPTVDANNAVKVQSGTGANQISLSSGTVTVGTNNDKTGYTASTVSDKTGYSLTQTFPTNFSSLSIDASGRIDLGKWIGVAPLALSSQQVQAVVPSSTVVASVSGAVGSVTGSVGSVTGNVGGNVVGSVGSVTGNVGGNLTGTIGGLSVQAKADVNAEADTALSDYAPLTAAGYTAPNNAGITSNSTDLGTLLGRLTALRAGYLDSLPHLDADVSTRLAASGYTAPPSASTTAAAVWDLATAGHTTAGTFGAAMSAAGGAGDPWTIDLPASYATGTAGYILGNLRFGLASDLAGSHGAGAWGPTDASGANTVNVTISNGTTGISNAVVTVYGSDGATLVDQKHTSNSGVASFSLDSASYKVSVGAVPGYSSLAVQSLSVAANPTAATYTLSAVVPTPPSSSLARTVYGYVYGPDGQPLAGRTVTATYAGTAMSLATNALLSHATLTTTTDSLGYWQLALIVGSNFTKGDGRFNVSVSGNGGSFGPFVVPAGSGAVNLETILSP